MSLLNECLHLERVNVCEQFAGLHLLPGDDEHLIHLPAHLGLNYRTQLRAHHSDHILRSHAFLASGNLCAGSHRWQRGRRGRFMFVSATGDCQQHCGCEKNRSFHAFLLRPN
jgi:hypothetical protein